MQKIQITTTGIKKALSRYEYPQAIAEYLWNGFDAKATCVEIIFKANSIGNIPTLTIKDNGRGIPSGKLSEKFTPFFESDKELDPNVRKNTSAVHGKNGVGRLTFFTFASGATWETVYEDEQKKRYQYEIVVTADGLDTYSASEPKETKDATGTTVVFSNVHTITDDNFKTDIRDFLMREFGWFVELNLAKPFSLKINGDECDYSEIVGDRDGFRFSSDGSTFDIRYVRWNQSLNKEYSRCYFIDSYNEERLKETTTLNNKGDQFYHSVFITSAFFNEFGNGVENSDNRDYQGALLGHVRGETAFKELMLEIDKFLRDKRRPFLKLHSEKLITDFEDAGAFPNFGVNEWDKFRKAELEQVIKEIYQIEPKIFSTLNIEQKKVFVHFLNLIIDLGERDILLNILGEIIQLERADREQLAQLLKVTKLSNIIKTIKLIEDRYKAVAELKELVFNPTLKISEPKHIQVFVENHYWLFGEQYHLVTSAEPKFEEALRRFVYLLRGEITTPVINHPDKLKEMDIFMVRQLVNNSSNIVNNVVIELKNPVVKLGSKELEQVKKYLGVILKESDFNGKNLFWEFYLVGNEFDGSEYIEREIKNARSHGEKSLAYFVDNYKIYVKTWSEIFTDFELKHKFLYDKLKLEREKLITSGPNADNIVRSAINNSAIQPSQVQIPQ